MLKHLAHSHHKLHTFDDFYNENNSKGIKSRLSSNDLLSTTTTTTTTTTTNPSSPQIQSTTNLDHSPSNNQYTFYNIFSDLKSTTTPDVVIKEEEDEDGEIQTNIKYEEHESAVSTPVFYLEDDHHNHSHSSSSSSSVSPHWPTLILNRFRHSNPHHQVVKQNSVNENQCHSTKMRKNEFSDLSINNKRRFLKRSETVSHTVTFNEKKSLNDDFPQLFSSTSLHKSSTNNHMEKKHRSFASLFHHFHHNHQNSPNTNSNKSNSTGSLHTDNSNSNTKTENLRPRLSKQRTLPSTNDLNSSVTKSPSTTPILPKLASFFTRHHHSSEHHKYRIGNLKARLHHRRKSPQLNNNTPKFQCQASAELIQEVEQLDGQNIYSQRPIKPVIMKRVHTWHNAFDLRPLDQCLEY